MHSSGGCEHKRYNPDSCVFLFLIPEVGVVELRQALQRQKRVCSNSAPERNPRAVSSWPTAGVGVKKPFPWKRVPLRPPHPPTAVLEPLNL